MRRAPPSEKGSALTAAEVLGLVKALRRQAAERAELLAAIPAEEAVGVVLDDCHAPALSDLHDLVHLAPDARVVHRHGRPRVFGDGALELTLVEVQSVRPDVDEHRPRAAQDKRVGGGHEREGRHDHLVTRLDVEQECGHLERMGAGGGQEGFLDAQLGLQVLVAAFGEGAVAGDVTRCDRRRDVLVLPAFEAGAVERDQPLACGH